MFIYISLLSAKYRKDCSITTNMSTEKEGVSQKGHCHHSVVRNSTPLGRGTTMFLMFKLCQILHQISKLLLAKRYQNSSALFFPNQIIDDAWITMFDLTNHHNALFSQFYKLYSRTVKRIERVEGRRMAPAKSGLSKIASLSNSHLLLLRQIPIIVLGK